jgi:hypothetical protein
MSPPLKQERGGNNKQIPQQIKCYQVNVQHSKATTANLMQMISTDKVGMALIQETYQYQGKLTGITKRYRTFTCGEGKRGAAIIIQENTIDALLITQLLEIKTKNSMALVRERTIPTERPPPVGEVSANFCG